MGSLNSMLFEPFVIDNGTGSGGTILSVEAAKAIASAISSVAGSVPAACRTSLRSGWPKSAVRAAHTRASWVLDMFSTV